MLKIQLKYLRYAIIAAVLAVVAFALTPALQQWPAFVKIAWPYTYWAVAGVAAVLIVWMDVRMTQQALNQRETEGVTTLWLPIFGQTAWFGIVVWAHLQPRTGMVMQTMTLPVMLLGLAGLYVAMGLLQRRERVVPLDAAQKKSVVWMTWLTVFFAVYSLLFFGITMNWQAGVTIALAVLLITDPRWPALWSGWRRFNILRDLANDGVTFQNPHAIDDVANITDLMLEKNGILSTDDDVRIHMVQSVDERYSDFDILGIAAGLLKNYPEAIMTSAILRFADENGVYPSDATEPEFVPFEGIHGVIYNERFALLSVPEALANYEVDQRYLKTMADLGNSVAYVVNNRQLIGTVVYSATADYAALAFDRFMQERGLSGHVVTSDLSLATHKVTDMMSTIVTVATEMPAAQKGLAQADWTNRPTGMLVTNQPVPAGVQPGLTVAVGETPRFADIHVDSIEKLPLLWETNDRLQGADKKVLRRTSVLVFILVLLATGMGIFIDPILFVSPILAILIRLAASFTVAAVVEPDEETLAQ